MTASELRDRLLRVLRAEYPDQTPTFVHIDVAIAVNQALQEIWLAPGLDYLRRQKTSFSTVNGTFSYTLAQNFLRLLGPVSAPSWDLLPLTTKGDFLHFADRYLEPTPTAVSSGYPRAYYLERLNRGTHLDPIECNLLLTPTPTSVLTISYEAAFEPPAFDKCDLETDATIPVPHALMESILLPIAAEKLLSASWFQINERSNPTAAIQAQAQAARAQVGLADPQINTAAA